MPYFINPVKEDECVFLTYEGDLSLIEIIATRYEASALLASKRWNRIVVDITELQSLLTAQELSELAKGLSEDLPRNARIALVIRPEQEGHAKLIESAARNEGVFLAFFFDVEEATTWVKETTLYEPSQHRPASRHP
jgi:hypothetical protein